MFQIPVDERRRVRRREGFLFRFAAAALATCALAGCAEREPSGTPAPAEPISSSRTLACTANFQQNGAGSDSESAELATVFESENSTVLAVAHKGFDVRVDWNRPLTALYVNIEKGDDRLVFVTARVPSEDHNDSTVDLTLADGARFYVGCDMVEFRPMPF